MFLKKNNNMNVPKKKANKNDVYAIILAILIIFWTIASVFGIIGYARSSKKDSGVVTASAEAPPDIGLPTVNYATLHFNQYENFMLYNSSADDYILFGSYTFNYTLTESIGGEIIENVQFDSGGRTYYGIYLSFDSDEYSTPIIFFRSTSGQPWDTLVYNEYTLDGWAVYPITVTFTEPTVVSADFYDYFILNTTASSDDVYMSAWAQSLGYQSFTFNGLSLSYNDMLLINNEGEVDLVADFYTQFLFSDYQVHDVLTNVLLDELYGTPFFESSGFTILYRVDCEAFTDETSFYLYYTLYFDWYEDINDNTPITSTFGFTVYYDFTDYINTEYISNGIYFPAMDVHVTLADEYYYTYLYNEQYYKFNAYKEGYALGYGAGVDGGQDYTFFSLISSVIDAPIQAFTGLFNFDLLGINLTSFFLALLTVAVFIAVIRLIL